MPQFIFQQLEQLNLYSHKDPSFHQLIFKDIIITQILLMTYATAGSDFHKVMIVGQT